MIVSETTTPPARPNLGIGLDGRDEADLRWYFQRDYLGDVGYRSRAGSQIDALELGVSHLDGGRPGDLSEPLFRAARRLRVIQRRIALLEGDEERVLGVLYGTTREILTGFGAVGPLVLALPAAKREHSRHGVKQDLVTWLWGLRQQPKTYKVADAIEAEAQKVARGAALAWRRTWRAARDERRAA